MDAASRAGIRGHAIRPETGRLPYRTYVRYRARCMSGTSANAVAPVRDLPRRDAEARARLRAVATHTQPFVAARDRRLPVAGTIGELLPAGGVQRGSTVAVKGSSGSGSTTVALTLAAAATSAGEWAAVVDLAGSSARGALGARAAAEAGVELDRLAVVRNAPLDRWGAVVAALLDGVTLVVAAVPPRLRLGDARRLVARARERGAVLVAFGDWPVEAAVRVRTERAAWRGLDRGAGLLEARDLHVEVEVNGRGFARAG